MDGKDTEIFHSRIQAHVAEMSAGQRRAFFLWLTSGYCAECGGREPCSHPRPTDAEPDFAREASVDDGLCRSQGTGRYRCRLKPGHPGCADGSGCETWV